MDRRDFLQRAVNGTMGPALAFGNKYLVCYWPWIGDPPKAT
jgi:hypothetical protein